MRRTLNHTILLGKQRGLLEITDTRIKYMQQNREYEADPEEYVRAAVYVELVEDYHYFPSRIQLEVPIPA